MAKPKRSPVPKGPKPPDRNQVNRVLSQIEQYHQVDLRSIEDDGAALKAAADHLVKWQKSLDSAERKTRETAESQAKDQARLDSQAQKHTERERELEEREGQLETWNQTLDEREDELTSRAEAIIAREIDADSGFRERRQESLGALEEQRDKLLSTIAELESEESVRRSKIALAARKQIEIHQEQERHDLRAQWEALEDARAGLDKQLAELHDQRAELRRKQAAVDADAALARDRVDLELEARAHDLTERLRLQEQTLAIVRRERDGLAERVATLEHERQRIGDDPAGVARELEDSHQKLRRLRDEIANRPTPDEAIQLRAKAQAHDRLVQDLQEASVRVGQLEAENARFWANEQESQSLQIRLDSLQQRSVVLEQVVEDYKLELGELVERKGHQPAFPECTQMDSDRTLNTEIDTSPVKLSELASLVRSQIADDGLYYSKEDVQLFIAGLAGSRLHILEGISGTGKTSLPRAFAAALNAGCQLIEVQAGWRDRDDLLGFYNSFEARFRETEFTKALYRAALPAYQDRPFFVILDEANLSHVEQYFAEMLSKLENPSPIPLVHSRVPNAPARLLNDRELPWPSNVWFVLTANNDETTYRFAHKTYDRSQVLKLPPRPEEFTVTGGGRLPTVSLQSLVDQFDAAVATHQQSTQRIVTEVRGLLADSLEQHANVGWGPRIDAHLKRVVAVGKELGLEEAVSADHVFTTKVIRKVTGRFDLRWSAVKSLRDDVEAAWFEIFRKAPVKALRDLDQELSRSASVGVD
jgi:hypothetical protein